MAIIGSISNNQSIIKGTDAHDDEYHSNLKNEWTLFVYGQYWNSSNSTLKDYGEMTTSLSGVNYTRPENWPRSHGMAASGTFALVIGKWRWLARLIFTCESSISCVRCQIGMMEVITQHLLSEHYFQRCLDSSTKNCYKQDTDMNLAVGHLVE